MPLQVEEFVEELKQVARFHRQEARRYDAAVRTLLEPIKPQGRPVMANRDLLETFRKSGLSYQRLAAAVGASYKLCSWVIRGVKTRPALEARIRQVLATASGEVRGSPNSDKQITTK
jgi:hypothetical protein